MRLTLDGDLIKDAPTLMNRAAKGSAFSAAITFFMILLYQPGAATAEQFVNRVEEPVNTSVKTRQASRKELDKWEEERRRLETEFELLSKKNKALTESVTTLKKQETAQKKFNASLTEREVESRRISEEIGPFTTDLIRRLEDMVRSDLPFLRNERKERLGRLETILDDPEISVAEKFRKVMEALFIEAEYGTTIEVYQEKITLIDEEMLGDIFRLGRLGLFFLSLDHETSARFNMAKQSWEILDSRYTPEIEAAIEMGLKRRPSELLCLPAGRLAAGKEGM